MPKQIHTTVAAVVLAVICLHTPTVDAQNLRSRQPLQRGFRWLGQGWSSGYHHRNPGPNTDYYNPYTVHNSMLLSKMPGYQAGGSQYGHGTYLPNIPGSDHNSANHQSHGQSIEPSFVPVDEDEDESGDFDIDDAEEIDGDDFDFNDPSSDASDPSEAASIREDAGGEDADFTESSFDSDELFAPPKDRSNPGTSRQGTGSDKRLPSSDATPKTTEPTPSGSGTKASKTGFSREEPRSLDLLDLESFLTS